MTTHYSKAEVRGLLKNYFALKEKKTTTPGSGLDILLRLADVERALHHIVVERRRVLTMMMVGHPYRDAAAALSEPYTTVYRAFDNTATQITDYLNGVIYAN